MLGGGTTIFQKRKRIRSLLGLLSSHVPEVYDSVSSFCVSSLLNYKENMNLESVKP